MSQLHKPIALVTDNPPRGFIDQIAALGYIVDYHPIAKQSQWQSYLPHYQLMVVNTSMKLDAATLAMASQLKYILRPGSGLDNIDLEACHSLGIQVFSSPQANGPAVGEHALGLALALLRNIPLASQQVAQGQWIRKQNTGTALSSLTVGIMGYGHTGSAFCQALAGFQLHTLVYDPYLTIEHLPSYAKQIHDWHTFTQEVNLLSLHLPLSEATHSMVTYPWLQTFSQLSYLINTARGSIVSIPALIQALQSGLLKGIALDVLPNENLASWTPAEQLAYNVLSSHPQVLITPHIAGWTHQSRANIFFELIKDLKAALATSE